MNKLSLQKRAQVIHLLVEGNSLRATSRLADVSYNTVLKTMVETGKAASEYQDEVLRNLTCKKLEIDEIWSFTYCKQKNINKVLRPREENGDCWTWVAMCPDTRLVPS